MIKNQPTISELLFSPSCLFYTCKSSINGQKHLCVQLFQNQLSHRSYKTALVELLSKLSLQLSHHTFNAVGADMKEEGGFQ